MKPKYEEWTVEVDVKDGSSIFGRFIRIITFPFKFILFGKASL